MRPAGSRRLRQDHRALHGERCRSRRGVGRRRFGLGVPTLFRRLHRRRRPGPVSRAGGIWRGATEPPWDYRADRWERAAAEAPGTTRSRATSTAKASGSITRHGRLGTPARRSTRPLASAGSATTPPPSPQGGGPPGFGDQPCGWADECDRLHCPWRSRGATDPRRSRASARLPQGSGSPCCWIGHRPRGSGRSSPHPSDVGACRKAWRAPRAEVRKVIAEIVRVLLAFRADPHEEL